MEPAGHHVGNVQDVEARGGGWKRIGEGAVVGGAFGALAGVGIVALSPRFEMGAEIGVAALQGLVGGSFGAGATILASQHFGTSLGRRVFRGMIGGAGMATFITVIGHMGARNVLGSPSWQLSCVAAGAGFLAFFPSACMGRGVGSGLAGTMASLGFGGFISLGVAELAEKVLPFIGRHSYSQAGWCAFLGFLLGVDFE